MNTAEDEEIVRKRLAAGTIQSRGDYPFRTLAKLCAAAPCRTLCVLDPLCFLLHHTPEALLQCMRADSDSAACPPDNPNSPS